MQLLMTNHLLGFFVLLLLSSCTTQNIFSTSEPYLPAEVEAQDSVFAYTPDYQYHIRKNDKISISVWGQDELSVGSVYGIYNSNQVYGKWLLVDAEGKIEVPKIGTMPVAGQTIIELKRMLSDRFAKWVKNPIVDVKILNKEITVLGEVRDPQVVQIDSDQKSVLEIIATCKGLDFYANLENIKVLRQHGENVHVATLDLSEPGDYLRKNIQLHPGDVLIVPSRKHKNFDKRLGTIIPFTTTATAAAVLMGTF